MFHKRPFDAWDSLGLAAALLVTVLCLNDREYPAALWTALLGLLLLSKIPTKN